VLVAFICSTAAPGGITMHGGAPRGGGDSLLPSAKVGDVPAAVLFLSSGQARWISGQVLAVNGGGPYYGGGGVSASASSASATAASSVSAHGKASG
jgi:hypothetical protein